MELQQNPHFIHFSESLSKKQKRVSKNDSKSRLKHLPISIIPGTVCKTSKLKGNIGVALITLEGLHRKQFFDNLLSVQRMI